MSPTSKWEKSVEEEMENWWKPPGPPPLNISWMGIGRYFNRGGGRSRSTRGGGKEEEEEKKEEKKEEEDEEKKKELGVGQLEEQNSTDVHLLQMLQKIPAKSQKSWKEEQFRKSHRITRSLFIILMSQNVNTNDNNKMVMLMLIIP